MPKRKKTKKNNALGAATLPTSKEEVMEMTALGLNNLYKSGLLPKKVDDWLSLKLDGRRKAIADMLFPEPVEAYKGEDVDLSEDEPSNGAVDISTPEEAPEDMQGDINATVPTQVNTNDFISQTVSEIEKIDSQHLLEHLIQNHLEQEPEGIFKLGGLFHKLYAIGDWSNHGNFKNYVEDRFGIKYRKARYLVNIYETLIALNIDWNLVKDVGWTKLKLLIKVLTKDNVDEWVAKAHSMNLYSLEKAIKLALANDAPAETSPVITKTFKLNEGQADSLDMALKTAKNAGNIETDAYAIELIALDYTAGSNDNTLAAQNAKLKEELDGIATQKTVMPDVLTFLKHLLKQHNGNKKAALGALLGDSFDQVFPGLSIKISSKTQ